MARTSAEMETEELNKLTLLVYDTEDCSQAMNSIIKEEDLNRDEMFYLPSDMPQFPASMNNFEVVESIGNTMSIPENSAFTIPYNDEMNQLLMSSTSDENFAKIPIDFGNLFKINGIKNEQPISSSHFVKYKPDENGKHVKIWECGICHKEFGHQYILMRHLPTHTDERKFQCKQCGKAFRQMSTLSQHRAIHSKLRPYVCEVCQKTFNRVSTLISHRKTHTGLKPHRCHLCNKAFHQKGNLRNHIFTHTNERPYKCDVCQKGFNQMSNLMCHKFKAHQRADKPKYNCQTCGKEFDKRIGLRNHEQYEHGEPTLASTVVNVPSVKYTNGVLVSPINTAAMKHAVATNQVPFALLRPLNGIPVLVRVLPAGDKQMLVPATAEDLKKFGDITIKKKDDEPAENKDDENKENLDDNQIPDSTLDVSNNTATISGCTSDDKKAGATVQIRIPVVASVVQRCRDGTMHMDIESPGPRREGQDDLVYFTTTDEEFNKQAGSTHPNEVTADEHSLNNDIANDDTNISNISFFEMEDRSKIVMQKDFSLNREAIQLFDTDSMVLDITTPMMNLADAQNMEEILPSELFNNNSNDHMYEIIDNSSTNIIQNTICAYEKEQEDFDIQVD